jgi:xanthosine utilization system XapX-like protein
MFKTTKPSIMYIEGCVVELHMRPCYLARTLCSTNPFAVGLKLPCLEAGMAADQPPLGLSFVRFGLSPPLPSVLLLSVKHPTPPTLCVGGVGFIVNLAPCYLARTLCSTNPFAVGMNLPCSEAGMAVDQPEHCSYKLRTSKSAD